MTVATTGYPASSLYHTFARDTLPNRRNPPRAPQRRRTRTHAARPILRAQQVRARRWKAGDRGYNRVPRKFTVSHVCVGYSPQLSEPPRGRRNAAARGHTLRAQFCAPSRSAHTIGKLLTVATTLYPFVFLYPTCCVHFSTNGSNRRGRRPTVSHADTDCSAISARPAHPMRALESCEPWRSPCTPLFPYSSRVACVTPFPRRNAQRTPPHLEKRMKHTPPGPPHRANTPHCPQGYLGPLQPRARDQVRWSTGSKGGL